MIYLQVLLAALLLSFWLKTTKSHKVSCQINTESFCWSSRSKSEEQCSSCKLEKIEILTSEIIEIETDFPVHLVDFEEGIVKYLPLVKINGELVEVQHFSVFDSNTKVLSKEFFGEAASSIVSFCCVDNFNFDANDDYDNDVFDAEKFYTYSALMIEENAFEMCTSLEDLNLRENNISSIPTKAFFGLKHLVVLNLDTNALTFIDPIWFQDLHSLEILWLSENRIKYLPNGVFDRLQSLNELYLDHNQIKRITSSLLAFNPCLSKVSLNHNEISKIQIGAIQQLINLTDLHMWGNVCICKYFKNTTSSQIELGLVKCLVTEKDIVEDGACKIPEIRDGFIVKFKDNSTLMRGSFYSDFETVRILCKASYFLIIRSQKQKENKCIDGEWMETWGSCQRLCSSKELNSLSTRTHCSRNNSVVSCFSHLLPGTIAKIYCKGGYKYPKKTYDLSCLPSGQWDKQPFICQPVCGFISPQAKKIVTGGEISSIIKIPWHVSVYRERESVCGGTLISERVVVSAAHCFLLEEVQRINETLYIVAAGKSYRSLNVKEMFKAQIKKVQEINVPQRYQGNSKHLLADIATIIVQGYFEYKIHVAPACLEFQKTPLKSYPDKGSLGLIAACSEGTQVLGTVNLSVIDLKTCKRSSINTLKSLFCGDKICLKFDGTMDHIDVLGNGLMMPKTLGGQEIYYLAGVASRKILNNIILDSKSFQYILFTNVQKYEHFIHKAINKSIM